MKKSHLLGAFGAGIISFAATIVHAVVLPLESRLGGLAYYDPNLDITWATDATLSGLVTWSEANTWLAGLTIGGVGGWRLPNMDVNGDGTVVNCLGGGISGCEDNEYGYLYWEEGIRQASPTPFTLGSTNNQTYWSSTETGILNSQAYTLNFTNGVNTIITKTTRAPYAWAVHDGDVVPIPPALWLFASGLLGLLGIARHKKAAQY